MILLVFSHHMGCTSALLEIKALLTRGVHPSGVSKGDSKIVES